MKINFNIPNLSWEFIDKLRCLSSSNETIIKEKIETKINNYLDILSLIIKLINESNNLSNEEFHNILTKVCETSFNKTDILNIISLSYNKNFTNYQTIRTSMVSKTTDSEYPSNSLDYCEEDVRTIYRVACEENLSIDEDKAYNTNEIQQLLDNKQIVIVKENTIELDEYIETKEEYKQFKILNQSIFLNKDSEFYNSTINYIKNYIGKEKIRSRLIRYIEKLEEDIIELEYLSQSKNYLYEKTPSVIVPILNKINYFNRLENIKTNLGMNKDNKKLIRKKEQ